MYLWPQEYNEETGTWPVTGRYHEKDWISGVDELAFVFSCRYFNREFGSSEWINLAIDYGTIVRNEKVVVEYTRG